MIIVGELINASRKSVGSAIENNDVETVKKLALDQAENGADYIDANAGVFVGKEADYLKWLVETVQAAADKPCSIDSPDPRAIETALAQAMADATEAGAMTVVGGGDSVAGVSVVEGGGDGGVAD